jgi:hypothetical protein
MISMLTKASSRKRGDVTARKRDDDNPPKTNSPDSPRPRGRRPKIDTLLAEAAKGGKTVTSITLPDGTKLTFGEGEQTSSSSNPWLEELKKQQ